MNRRKKLVYRTLLTPVRLYQKLFLRLHVWGRDNIPSGPKIYVQNHIASTDPYWVVPLLPEPVHVIVGPGYHIKALALVLNYLEQINATEAQRKHVVDKAVEYLKSGESVYTAPEGDLHKTFHLGRFYPGVARIYRRVPVPIIPIALLAPRFAMKAHHMFDMEVDGHVYRGLMVLRGPFCINIGRPFMPELRETGDETEDNLRIMAELRQRMQGLIEDIRVRKFWL